MVAKMAAGSECFLNPPVDLNGTAIKNMLSLVVNILKNTFSDLFIKLLMFFHQHPSGYSCTLSDVNECAGDHPCQQDCGNLQGSYACLCFQGYTNIPNNDTHCEGKYHTIV